uniref:CSRNP_N domain-containing protein n=1 Tax=Anopheles atroparvus TaxID=41427 RepID=A0A182IQY0_ANOAO
MLKPIKTFLTYLQRNANSSNIFGLTTTMGPTEQPRLEESIMIANEDLANESGDPLYDPLALDDDCPGEVAVESINVPDDVEDGVASGKIILVDVTSLKSSMDQSNELETDDEDADEEAMKITSETENCSAELLTISCSSDVGGGSENTSQIVVLDRSSDCVIEVDSDGVLDSSSVTENDSFTAVAIPVTPVMIVEEVVEIEQEKALPNGHDTADHAQDILDAPITITPCDDQHQKQKDGENAASKTTTLSKQIQGALPISGAEAEEEEASDGSDSGLGLEPARSVAPTSNSSNTPLELPPIKSSLKRRSEPVTTASEVDEGVSKEKRPKKAITFEGVTVYYFPRIQGFGCVPSQGGCTLGMEFQHVHSRRLTLAEHSSEQRKVHRQQLQELNPRSSSSDDTSSEDEPSESGSEAESESYAFLQPVSTRQRRALLKAAGVRKIDSTEKDECREIRTSREVCGCTCRGFCDPATCACSLTGIKCQVDRPNFPCGCTQEGCANKAGRVEFNQGRVRTHFIHTIMRLNLEGKANEMHRPAVTNAPGASGSSNVVDGGTTSENGYVAESEKNWSNGPIRLQQQQQQPGMVYVGGTHAPVLPPGHSGMETEGTLVPMNHLHSLPPSQYHQPLPLQAQHQYFGPQSHESYMADPAYHDYMPSNAQMLLTAVPTSNPQHLIDGLISTAAHSTDPVDVHYAYRDYFVGGTTSGAAAAATPASEQQLLPHGQLYYTYGGGSSPGVGGSTDPNYRHLHHLPVTAPPLPPPPIHQLAGTGSISPYHQQHTLPTGHDRHLTGYEVGVTPLSATGERDSTLRIEPPSSATTSTTLDTPDGSSYASSQPLLSSNRDFPPEKENPPNVPLSDSSAEGCILLDSSVEEVVMNESETVAAASPVDNASSSPVIAVDDNDDDDDDADDDHRRTEQSSAARHPSRRSESSDSERIAQSSCFIDLSAPVAGNAEHLEAINDMLASSRRSATLARRSIAAEDDDELRDFRHSPLPPAVTIESDDDDDDDNGVIVVDSTNNSTPTTATSSTPLVVVNGNEESSVHQNGTEAHAVGGANERRDVNKRVRQDTPSPSQMNSNDDEGTKSSPVGSRLLANKLAKTDTGAVLSVDSSGLPSSPGDPTELCEIIKNSIVETAVSH